MNNENVNLKEATIIDVRTSGEYCMGCVEGSINIPLDQVPQKIETFKSMKKPIVVCCASGARSAQAVQYLMANSVDNIYDGGSWNMVAMRMI